MKKASFAVMGLGAAVLIFAIVCFIVAGGMIKDIESYAGMLMGGMPGMDGKALIDLVIDMGFDVGGFALFAYKTRVWFLIGGLVILGGGALMFVMGGKGVKGGAKRGGKHNYVPAASYGPVCPACGAKVNSGAAFCMNCGSPMAAAPAPAPVIDKDVICTCCGARNEEGARFCVNCGSELIDHIFEAAPAEPVGGPVYGGASYVGSSTGTISATVVNGEAGTIRLDTSAASSTGTVRIDTRAEAAAAAAPAPFAPAAEPAPFVSEPAAATGTVMLNVEKPAEKPSPMKSRLSKAGDL